MTNKTLLNTLTKKQLESALKQLVGKRGMRDFEIRNDGVYFNLYIDCHMQEFTLGKIENATIADLKKEYYEFESASMG